MNERTLRRFLLPLAIALGLGAAACQQDPGAPPLAGASIGGPFTLTDQAGNRVTDRDFAGAYRLVYFGYSFCPDVCPVDLQVLGAGLKQFEAENPERAAKVQPIFVTVDPARDTPEALRPFVGQFHPRLIGLTGSEEEVAAAAREFGVFHAKEGDDPENYLVSHSQAIFLLGPEGEPIAIVPHDQGPGAVAAELDKWVR